MSKNRMICRTFVAVALGGLLSAARADASCVYLGPLCQTWKTNAAIFDGTVRSIERLDRAEEIGGRMEQVGHRLVTFLVHESWRGDVGDRVQLVLWGGSWGGRSWTTSTDFRVEIGRRYVILAHRTPLGELSTSGCSGSRLYEEAASELAFLRSLKAPPTGGRILGDVALFVPPLEPNRSTRLQVDAIVRLTGQGIDRSIAVTDHNYQFEGLPPGSYNVSARGPAAVRARPDAVDVHLEDARSCQAVGFSFRYDTSVSGIVTDSAGRPLKYMKVEAAVAASWREAPTYVETGYTDATGRFEMGGLPPGEYVVGLNLRDDVRYTEHPRTMYSGADRRPEIIRVDFGQQVWLGQLTIGVPLPPIKMRVRLTGTDGAVLRSVRVMLLDVTTERLPDELRYVAVATTDAEGWVEFDGRATRRYVIERSIGKAKEEKPRTSSFAAEQVAAGMNLVLRER